MRDWAEVEDEAQEASTSEEEEDDAIDEQEEEDERPVSQVRRPAAAQEQGAKDKKHLKLSLKDGSSNKCHVSGRRE